MHTFPPIEPLVIQKQKPSVIQKKVSVQMSQLHHEHNRPSEECRFFPFPCTTHSKQNKQTLTNQKSLLNETEIELTQSKNLMTLTRISHQKPQKTNTSLQKSKYQNNQNHSKGITLSITSSKRQQIMTTTVCKPEGQSLKKNEEKQKQTSKQTQVQNYNNKDTTVIFIKPFDTNQNLIKSQHKEYSQNITQNKIFHHLNPLSIDRSKYDAREVKIGGNKNGLASGHLSFHKNDINKVNVNFVGQFSNFVRNVSREKKQVESSPKSRIMLTQRRFQRSQALPILPYNCDYGKDSYQLNYSGHDAGRQSLPSRQINFDKRQNFSQSFYHQGCYQSSFNGIFQNKGHIVSSIPLYSCNTRRQEPQTINTKRDYFGARNTHNPHNDSLNDHSTRQNQQNQQQVFSKIHLNHPAVTTNQLVNSTFSTYSQKYRDYMSKELTQQNYEPEQNKMLDLLENVRIEVDSVNQEQNQKSQTNLSPKYLKMNQRRDQRAASYSSSFVVVQNKEKQLQNTRKIYLPSYIGSSSVPQSGLINQIDHYLVNDLEKQRNEKNLDQIQSSLNDVSISQLNSEIQTLANELNSLLAQQRFLQDQIQRLQVQKANELYRESNELQSIECVSEQRCEQIDVLRQLLKVKIIKQKFCNNEALKDKYLNDQKGWELYISYDGDFQCLNESNDTNETQNQKIELNKTSVVETQRSTEIYP